MIQNGLIILAISFRMCIMNHTETITILFIIPYTDFGDNFSCKRWVDFIIVIVDNIERPSIFIIDMGLISSVFISVRLQLYMDGGLSRIILIRAIF